MPAGYYVRATAGKAEFTTGPFPSKEDALDEGPAALKLGAGETFEVGIMIPFTPRIEPDDFLLGLIESARAGCGEVVSSGWVHTLSTLPQEDLAEGLNLVFQGWLTKHEAHPNFGLVDQITTHTFTP